MDGIGGIEEIIRKSPDLQAGDKEVLMALFEGLWEEQEKLYGELEERVGSELAQYADNKKHKWEVATALIREEEKEKARKEGMYLVLDKKINREHMEVLPEEIGEEGYLECGIAFLKCRYPEVGQYMDKCFRAHVRHRKGSFEAEYRLFLEDCYLEQEKLLEQTAVQYGYQQPRIFAPMSRRAVYVCVDFEGKEVPAGAEIDFDYAGNGLADVLLAGWLPVWNVEILDPNQGLPQLEENTEKKIVPCFDKNFQIYKANVRSEREYLHISGNSIDELEVKRIDGKIYIGVPAEQDEWVELNYQKLILHPLPIGMHGSEEFYFDNFWDREAEDKERLRTEADVAYAVRKYSLDGEGRERLHYQGCSFDLDGAESVAVYEARRSYHYPKDKYLKGGSICYLRFEKEDNMFFEDKVSYLLSFLNFRYPEYRWVGVA